ncbi:hypothetical protein FM038_25360 [Shewanella eurypsychrophilus]|uniref:Uncharacterized protein n=1 Tax=Shewanella eurypsychrophilus TaxID=2593656 RepID=A0ABX8S6U4_9GAMM|nr:MULTISPECIES: hypothetical protein [Shewanella]QXP44989.1 hypothetical protein FM038_25360 [Shewanella eurypsychrophilus]
MKKLLSCVSVSLLLLSSSSFAVEQEPKPELDQELSPQVLPPHWCNIPDPKKPCMDV